MQRDEERVLLVTGILGLGFATFLACGGPEAATPARTSSTEAGAPVALACTSDPAAAENAAAVVKAANALVAALTPAQQAAIKYEKTLANAEQWSNFPAGFIPRNGIKLEDMSAEAKAAAAALAEVAAGRTGATLYSEIRSADSAFATIPHAGPPGGGGPPPGGGRGGPPPGGLPKNLFGDGLFYVSFHGTPSASSPWMLQLAGHHFAYNFTYGGKCTSATPLFDGAQPSAWTDSAGRKHAPLEGQRAAIASLLGAVGTLPGAHLNGTFSDMLNGPAHPGNGGRGGTDTNYPAGLTYPKIDRGASVAAFSSDQKARVKAAIEAWVKNAADPVSSALLAEYESDDALSKTYIGYSGATDLSTQNSYARIDGPRVWIEFTVQEGTVTSEQGHYHTIWRDKIADYGADYFMTP